MRIYKEMTNTSLNVKKGGRGTNHDIWAAFSGITKYESSYKDAGTHGNISTLAGLKHIQNLTS